MKISNECNMELMSRYEDNHFDLAIVDPPYGIGNFTKEGDKILDTHLGSGSIAIACHNLKYDLTACELDKEYFDSAMKRIKRHQQQIQMF